MKNSCVKGVMLDEKRTGKVNIKVYARAVVAIVLLVTWFLVAVSGVILWLAPEGPRSGRVPLLFDMTKSSWKEVHLWIAAVTLVITLVHIIVDWKTLRAVLTYMVSTHRDNSELECD